MDETSIDLDQTEQDILALGVADEELEAAATKTPDPYKTILLQFGC